MYQRHAGSVAHGRRPDSAAGFGSRRRIAARRPAATLHRIWPLALLITMLASLLSANGVAALPQQRGLQQSVDAMQNQAATISVNARTPDGSPLDQGIIVNLRSSDGGSRSSGTQRGSLADFNSLGVGHYTVEVIAAGYLPATEEVELTVAGQRVMVDVNGGH